MPTLLDMSFAAESASVHVLLLLPLLGLLMLIATAGLIAVGEAQRENADRVARHGRREPAPPMDGEAEDGDLDPR